MTKLKLDFLWYCPTFPLTSEMICRHVQWILRVRVEKNYLFLHLQDTSFSPSLLSSIILWEGTAMLLAPAKGSGVWRTEWRFHTPAKVPVGYRESYICRLKISPAWFLVLWGWEWGGADLWIPLSREPGTFSPWVRWVVFLAPIFEERKVS